ncbi:MAG: MFS transporter [Nitrospiraceae bacterium]
MKGMVNALRSGHWPSLVGAWLHFEVSFMVWLLIGALGISIADTFQLTATQKGLLVAVPLLSGAVLRMVVGFSSDWYGAKLTALALLVCEIAAVLWGWLGADNYLQMLAVGLLLGAAGASFAVALPIASRAYPAAHQGLAMGVAASANSGTVLAMFFAPRIAEHVGWHGVFGLMLAPLLMTMGLFSILVPKEVSRSRHEGHAHWWGMIHEARAKPGVYWLCCMYAVTFGGFAGLCSFLPIFFHDQYGIDLVRAGSITALCGLAGSVIRPFGGYVADRIGGLRALPPVFIAIAALVAVVGSLPDLSWAASLLVGALAVMGFGNGVVFQVVSNRFHKQIGMASGIIGAAGGFGGFFLPFWLGAFKDLTGSFSPGLWLFAALSLAAALSVLMASKRTQMEILREHAGETFSR